MAAQNGHPAVIVIVFISLGACFFFFALVPAAICCFIIKKKKKKSCGHQEVAEVIHVDGHRKIHEAAAGGGGGHGPQAVVVTIEDEVCIDEVMKKKEHGVGHGLLHGKHEVGGNSSSMEVAPSS
ncbi:uncharacterized protein LOC111021715 [Momordica charantia]|uniref:Uncharacterized protein LOC111021715 n=1 Tax=Momordica charantia TaxID=3673 RepID=A0A6J1DM43_MOMCH|nr:uncharacterized protein LOC111021715 [Momordica charantia]